MTTFVCIGVPYWTGEAERYAGAVEAIRASGLAERIGAQWIDLRADYGAYDNPVNAINAALAAAIAAHPQHIPLIFTGECTNCLGAVKGLERHQPQVMWYDSHGDFNTPETSPSGFLGGMPLAAMVGRGNEELLSGIGLAPLAESAITISDARDLDPEEGRMLRASSLRFLPEIAELLDYDWQGAPLYIHLDTDVVNTTEMPAMSYPAAGGPSLDLTIATLEQVLQTAQVVGVLFSLWNAYKPEADTAQASTMRLVDTVVAGLSGD